MPANKIVLGTRGSDLAQAQARLAAERLRAVSPQLNIEMRLIKTRGDQLPNEPLDARAGRKGLFTREIEDALRRREIDLGVHSAKDLPSDLSPELEIAAVLPRAEISDVLLMKRTSAMADLNSGAKIATGSVRRQHQLRWKRPDLEIVELRGNVPTRLRKLIENDWDGIVLARAGLERLGYDLSQRVFTFEHHILHPEFMTPPDFLPAGGQGIIALQIRRDDAVIASRVRASNHLPTWLCLRAERAFLRLLNVDCNAPVGVLATLEADRLTLRAQVFDEKNQRVTGEICSSLKEFEPEAIAAALQAKMYGGN